MKSFYNKKTMSIIVLFIIAILLAFCFILNYFSTDILEKDESDNISACRGRYNNIRR